LKGSVAFLNLVSFDFVINSKQNNNLEGVLNEEKCLPELYHGGHPGILVVGCLWMLSTCSIARDSCARFASAQRESLSRFQFNGGTQP